MDDIHSPDASNSEKTGRVQLQLNRFTTWPEGCFLCLIYMIGIY